MLHHLSHENGFELQHASNCQQDCGIIWDKRAAWQSGVVVLRIILQEALSDLSTT